MPYMDDVSARGPASQYRLEDGSYETIPENLGIRKFGLKHLYVWKGEWY
uniref:Uncharacterized protein n=1 Tax=Moniliophthora roreri TaxID=221103 RepID=A0A0W0F6S1_MONRR